MTKKFLILAAFGAKDEKLSTLQAAGCYNSTGRQSEQVQSATGNRFRVAGGN